MPLESDNLEGGIGLALSGGGYRAVLFHCGALWRLNELGVLSKVNRISSVSGGSIAAGQLAMRWGELRLDARGVATNLDQTLVLPLRSFCSRTLDVGAAVLGAINPFKSAGDELVDAYRDRLHMDVPLKSLPDKGPRFVFNSTNYATGVSFRFSKPYCGDYRIGLMKDHDFDVATAVACSSAFPPVFSPIKIDLDPSKFEMTNGADLFANNDFKRRLLLADGGVYDNLGLETVWGRYNNVLVSDGGKPFELQAEPSGNLAQLARVAEIALNQALALRKRVLVERFKRNDGHGAYWGIGTPIASYGLDQAALTVSLAKTTEMSQMRTRLNRFSPDEQEELINWGYAVCDAAVRAHAADLIEVKDAKSSLPFPNRDMG